MKILITGGCGFVGTNLIPDLLELGHDVVVIDNLAHGSYIPEVHDRVRFFKCDIRDRVAMHLHISNIKPDITFHFAGLVSIYDCHRDPSSAVDNNIVGSVNVFDALLAAGCPRVVFSETSAVYENCELLQDGYFEGQSDPTTVYATTKAAVALLAESYARTKGLRYTALRYFNIAGPIQDYKRTVPPLFAGFAIRMMGGNNPIIFGDGNRRRDFIHVDDVNDFHVQCLTDGRTIGQTYNLGRGQSCSLFEIGDAVATVLKARGYNLPDSVEYTFMPEINGEAYEIFADIRKALSLGWCPNKSIAVALDDTIAYLEKEIERGSIDPLTYMRFLNTDSVKIG
jgi:nucleoside-diphosphate-sugar epimerase